MKRRGFLLASLVYAWTTSVQAAPISLGKDAELDIGVLIQPQARFGSDLSPKGQLSNDFFLRRARLVLSGTLLRRFSFFFDTDQPNWGSRELQFDKQRAFFHVQDAFTSYMLTPDLTLDAGLMMVPFTHHAMQSAATLNTLDYHGEFADFTSGYVKYPPGAGILWRDGGVQARGRLFRSHLTYRAGVFQGVRCQRPEISTTGCTKLNAGDVPRFAASLRYQLSGDESESFFLQGVYFRSEPIVTFGLAANYQPRAVQLGESTWDFVAVGADGFAEIPISTNQELIAQASLAVYREGPQTPDNGTAWFTEVGYRVARIEPVVSLENFFHTNNAGALSPSDRTKNYFAVRAGINLWLAEHQANIKAELAARRFHDATVENARDLKQDYVGTLQVQLRF